MRITNNHQNLLVVLTGVILLLVSTNVFPAICHNGSGGGYSDIDGTGVSSVSSIDAYLIEILVIEGAGYYLEANTAFQKLLGMVELQELHGLDMGKYGNALKDAIVGMNNAQAIYNLLIQIAETTPYNAAVQEKLATFDYMTFCEEKGLTITIFKKVENYLVAGDITGVYKETRASFEAISSQMFKIYMAHCSGQLTDIELYRQINEDFAQTSLFGSYVARIFTQLKD